MRNFFKLTIDRNPRVNNLIQIDTKIKSGVFFFLFFFSRYVLGYTFVGIVRCFFFGFRECVIRVRNVGLVSR